MEWLTQYNIYLQGMILSAIIVGTLITTVTVLYSFNIKVPKHRIKYVYAFSSGFLIVTAIVGQWVTARHNMSEYFVEHNLANGATGDGDPTISQGLLAIIILLSGVALGTLFAYGMKKLIHKEHKHDHSAHEGHKHRHDSHPDTLSSKTEVMHESLVHKEKTPVIWMILTHRVPAGLILGILLVNFNNMAVGQSEAGEYSLAALLVFILHTIPDMIIVYYARIEAGHSRRSSLIFSILVKLILIPFIIIGISMTTHIDMTEPSTFWIMPLLLSVAGITMIWGAVFELAPSFIHAESNKDTYKLIFTFIIGLTLSMCIQLIHSH